MLIMAEKLTDPKEQALLGMYPDKCTGRNRNDGIGPCYRVELPIVLALSRITRNVTTLEIEIEKAKEDAELNFYDCDGLQVRDDGGGCFGSPYDCGIYTETK